jgi:hypothetical protein
VRSGLRAAAFEARELLGAARAGLDRGDAGDVVVSGMLAEQLARELGAGAASGAVVVGDISRIRRAAVLVHVMAGVPSEDDDSLVRAADATLVPVVLVQLWPQADWTPPFVLSPFVVECRAGEGFPIGAIASRIASASDARQDLAARIPVLREAVATRLLREATVRAALVGAAGRLLGASRPLLALEQARTLSRLVAVRQGSMREDDARFAAGIAAAALGAGLGLREAARAARVALPAPLVNAAVAAAATWALGLAAGRLAELRTQSS